MFRKYLLLISFLSFLTCPNGISSQQKSDEETLKGFDDFVAKVMSDWNIQGTAVAIIKNGKPVYMKGYGFRDVKNNLPVTVNTLFGIGSCTKAFTAAALCMLVDEGKMDLDKPVINYMPSFKLWDNYVTMNITARDMLCHRSGLPGHDFVWYGTDFTRKEIVDNLQYLEASQPFRTTFQYQNLMFVTSGYLVEQVAGITWEEFVKSRIFTPLEMNTSDFSVIDMQKTDDYSKPYIEIKGKVKEIPYMNSLILNKEIPHRNRSE